MPDSSTSPNPSPDDDAHAGAQYDDEEARLLPTEELEFEDVAISKNRNRFCTMLNGPRLPRRHVISPLLPRIQNAPVRFLSRFLPKKSHKAILLAAGLLAWTFLFIFFLSSELPTADGAGQSVVNLDCVDAVWHRKNECGLDGINCRPFSNASFAFRCPADCAAVQVLNPHAVGPLDVNYRPLVIGNGIYRGDSFICASALHAGIVSNVRGGCGRLTRVADHTHFASAMRHGITSIPFDAYFPLSFSISEDSSISCPADPRQILLALTMSFTVLISVFSSTSLQFFPIFTLIFAHVAFASDPPTASYRNITVLPDHISMFAKRILPAYFCAVVIYWTTVRRTLSGLEAQLEKTILWLGGFWFGALSNYTFEWIPISRLTAHDLNQQPDAKLALAVILVILICIMAQQIYSFWLEGRLLRYLGLYSLFILGILICLSIPGVSLRIHHYILALLLLPGTGMQTRPSLLYQGILLGLFVNGIARWDFDSILQTTDALRGDGTFDSLLPAVLQPVISTEAKTIVASFSWAEPPQGMQGISVLVNDVERDRAFFDDEDGSGFVWERDVELKVPEYFRFAYVRDGRTLDYTRAGTLFPNGTWSMPESNSAV
ncbi:uncharacterized protein EI97DRAFT_499302 [Westerdykella ornata]|uniref:LCCL domain-containing protein n=1 Tax=Westerdykella ornata TaxID=318751 RepID=A0A6A6JS71_WESOR|nr:uncharacterized protein EI97DRAFT_499302 [Westerdykella ornata]KAF2278718.1 hypothetical protein EI97DRAFT_499302 [Westerdykella ornata]